MHAFDVMPEFAHLFEDTADIVDTLPLALQVRVGIQQMPRIQHQPDIIKFDFFQKFPRLLCILQGKARPPGVLKHHFRVCRNLVADPVEDPGRHFHDFRVCVVEVPGILLCRGNLLDPVHQVLRLFDQGRLNIAPDLQKPGPFLGAAVVIPQRIVAPENLVETVLVVFPEIVPAGPGTQVRAYRYLVKGTHVRFAAVYQKLDPVQSQHRQIILQRFAGAADGFLIPRNRRIIKQLFHSFSLSNEFGFYSKSRPVTQTGNRAGNLFR